LPKVLLDKAGISSISSLRITRISTQPSMTR
jgi:hypothetical protein